MENRGRALADRIITYFGDHQPGFGRGISLDNGNQIAAVGVEDYLDLNAALCDLNISGLMDFATGVVDGTHRLERGRPTSNGSHAKRLGSV